MRAEKDRDLQKNFGIRLKDIDGPKDIESDEQEQEDMETGKEQEQTTQHETELGTEQEKETIQHETEQEDMKTIQHETSSSRGLGGCHIQ